MEEMQDFPALLAKLEIMYPGAAAFKILPPTQWKAKYGGFDEHSTMVDEVRALPKIMLSKNLGNEIYQIFNNPPQHFKESTQHIVKVYPAMLYFVFLLFKGCH